MKNVKNQNPKEFIAETNPGAGSNPGSNQKPDFKARFNELNKKDNLSTAEQAEMMELALKDTETTENKTE